MTLPELRSLIEDLQIQLCEKDERIKKLEKKIEEIDEWVQYRKKQEELKPQLIFSRRGHKRVDYEYKNRKESYDDLSPTDSQLDEEDDIEMQESLQRQKEGVDVDIEI